MFNMSKSKQFIYLNARPIDFARWRYLFENGSRDDVLNVLKAYQNKDGGFANALEADCWNIESSPIQTWNAIEILKELNFSDRNHPIIQGILSYLGSEKSFDGHFWANTIPTNNDYPHAPCWEYYDDSKPLYNPTATLIGFGLKYADEQSELYNKCKALLIEAYEYFCNFCPIDSFHTAFNFVELYEYLVNTKASKLIDMNKFYELLTKQIEYSITWDTSTWNTDYVCKPSNFISSKNSAFYPKLKSLCDIECDFIAKSQNSDGTWNITWEWTSYQEQWHISKNIWKSDLIIRNIKFLKEFETKDNLNK